MSRYALRWSRCSGSTRRLIERILERGWEPGLPLRNYWPNRKRRAGGGQ